MLKKEQMVLEIIEKNINTKANTYIENLSLLLGIMIGKDYKKYKESIEKEKGVNNIKQRICRYITSICNEIGIDNLEELEKIYGYDYEYVELNILKGLCVTGIHISDMEKKNEIRLRYVKKIEIVEKFLKENNIEYVEKNNAYILTKGDSIAELLRILNLTNFLLRFEEKRTQKEYMNNTNRAINFEIANMGKIIKTSSEQMALFDRVKQEGKEEMLTDKQKEFLDVRIKNPDISIGEIAKKLRDI